MVQKLWYLSSRGIGFLLCQQAACQAYGGLSERLGTMQVSYCSFLRFEWCWMSEEGFQKYLSSKTSFAFVLADFDVVQNCLLPISQTKGVIKLRKNNLWNKESLYQKMKLRLKHKWSCDQNKYFRDIFDSFFIIGTPANQYTHHSPVQPPQPSFCF